MKAAKEQGNSHMRIVNKELMECFSELDSLHKMKQYSTVGLTPDRKKAMKQTTLNPAITIMAMSTPKALYDEMDMESIKDGFWNRFLVYLSDAEIQRRKPSPPLDVPSSIVSWIKDIQARRGFDADQHDSKPHINVLHFDDDVQPIIDSFEDFKIEEYKKLEPLGLEPLPMRLPEIAMRISLIVALSRNPMAERVTKDDMAWSIDWVRRCYEYARDTAKRSVSSSPFEKRKLESLAAIRKAGEHGVSVRELNTKKPFSTYQRRDRQEVIDSLLEAELICVSTRTTSGRPASVWIENKEKGN
jgi:hypothetical protein